MEWCPGVKENAWLRWWPCCCNAELPQSRPLMPPSEAQTSSLILHLLDSNQWHFSHISTLVAPMVAPKGKCLTLLAQSTDHEMELSETDGDAWPWQNLHPSCNLLNLLFCQSWAKHLLLFNTCLKSNARSTILYGSLLIETPHQITYFLLG